MITLNLTDLNQGHVLSHNWLHLAPVSPKAYPNDHGYLIYYKSWCLGECKVMEKRILKVANITQMLAYMICGYSREHLLRKMEIEGLPTAEDATVYLIQFQYIKYYKGIRRAINQALETNMAKNTNNKNFQYHIS